MTDTNTTTSTLPTVFVGNLPRAINRDSLLEFFNKDGAVNVTNPKIIRPMTGRVFGFVNVADDAELKKVIDMFHDKELLGRKLSIQASTALPQEGERKPRESKPRERRQRPEGGNNANNASGNNNSNNNGNSGNGNNNNGGNGNNNSNANSGNDNNNNANGTTKRPRVRRPRGPRKTDDANDNNGNANNNSADNTNTNSNGNNNAKAANGGNNGEVKKRRTRPARPPRTDEPEKPREKIDPTCTLFVANLPFSVDEEQLKTLMAGPSGSVVSTRIIRSRFNKRSKGFGFVTYDSTTARDEAFAANNNKEVEGRALSVNIAKEEAEKKEDESAKQ